MIILEYVPANFQHDIGLQALTRLKMPHKEYVCKHGSYSAWQFWFFLQIL